MKCLINCVGHLGLVGRAILSLFPYNGITQNEGIMESSNEALIKFLIKKDELLKESDPDIYRDFPYLLPEDIQEIKEWSEIDCIKVIERISNEGDANFCPWCILNAIGPTCKYCGYGKRHGICRDMESTYYMWTKAGSPSIVERLKDHSKEMLDELYDSQV